jgi:hypothetical protein
MIPHELIREKGPYGSILVGCPAAAAQLVNYQLQILMRHRPDWLIPCYVRYRSGKPQVCLDISDLLPLDEAYAGQARTLEDGRLLLGDICSLLLAGEDHLLPLSQFSLHPSLIYLDRNRSVRLAFWPYRDTAAEMAAAAAKASAETELPTLVRMIGNAFDWPEEQVNAAAGACQNGLPGLVEYLAGPQKTAQAPDEPGGQTDPGNDAIVDSATATGPRRKDREPDRQTSRHGKRNLLMVLLTALHLFIIAWSCAALLGLWPASRNYILPVLSVLALADLCLFMHSRKQNRPGNSAIVKERTTAGQPAEHKNLWDKLLQAADMGSDNTTGDEDRTVLLAPSESGFRMAMLCEGQPGTAAEHEGIRAFILVDEFIIGRDQKKADLCLPDQAVGRTHARITRRAGSFFICDLGSGNGTQVDGRRLQKHEESLLPDRCLLQFADRSFYFQAD